MIYYLLTFGGYLLAMLGAYGLARWATGRMRAAALRWGVLSPVTGRSSHQVPTPRLGGVGLAVGFGTMAALWLGLLWLIPHDRAMLGFIPPVVGWVGAGWLAMLMVGLLDDRFDLPPLLKLGLMTLAGLIAVWGAQLRLEPAHWGWISTRGHAALGAALALIWILFFTNAYNFMDGMDGFAAGFARVVATVMFFMLLIPGLLQETIIMIRAEAFLLPLLAMACGGFLHWNRPPARVFMGDGGSLSTGFLLAVFPLLGLSGKLGLSLPWVGSITLLLPFLFDVVLTLVRRGQRGENLLQAHREHLYQRLMRTGLTHAEVLRINRLRFYACGALAMIAALVPAWWASWLGLAGGLAVMAHYWRRVVARERAAARTA